MSQAGEVGLESFLSGIVVAPGYAVAGEWLVPPIAGVVVERQGGGGGADGGSGEGDCVGGERAGRRYQRGAIAVAVGREGVLGAVGQAGDVGLESCLSGIVVVSRNAVAGGVLVPPLRGVVAEDKVAVVAPMAVGGEGDCFGGERAGRHYQRGRSCCRCSRECVLRALSQAGECGLRPGLGGRAGVVGGLARLKVPALEIRAMTRLETVSVAVVAPMSVAVRVIVSVVNGLAATISVAQLLSL